MTIAVKKIEIVKQVLEEKDEEILNQLAVILAKNAGLSDDELVAKYTRPLEKDFDLEKFFAEQGEKRFNSEEISKLSKEANITETTEELIKMLD